MSTEVKFVAPRVKPDSTRKKPSYGDVLKKVVKDKAFYFILLPGLCYFLLFHYVPMYGAIIAFKDFKPIKGIMESDWVGFKNFIEFFSYPDFWTILSNTVIISLYKIIWGFPAPIVLALLLNELRSNKFKRTVQTITYLPHFLSWIIMVGLLDTFLSPSSGVINMVIQSLGLKPVYFLADPKYFRSILVLSDIWKEVGWGSIIYLAAISNVNIEMYESAIVNGANKWQQMLYITIPSISPTIVTMFILRVGGIMNAGFEQIFVLYSPNVYSVSDIIDTYVYRMGLEGAKYSLATAIGLFKSVIAFALIIATNQISKKIDEEHGIW